MTADNNTQIEGNIVHVDDEAYDPDLPPLYDTVFPPLIRQSNISGQEETIKCASEVDVKQQPYPFLSVVPNITPVRGFNKTEAFKIPFEERRFTSANDVPSSNSTDPNQAGPQKLTWEQRQKKICSEVAQKHRVSVEMNLAKDGTLSVFITGRDPLVMEAKRALLRALQTQAQVPVFIPKEYHKAILGPKGSFLQEIQTQTSTNISVPKPEENSDFVTITGPRDHVEHARQLLQTKTDELARKGSERLPIERRFHPLIFNRVNKELYDFTEGKDVRISVPPYTVNKHEVAVSGEKEAVEATVELIKQIHTRLKKDCQEFAIEVAKEKHKYIRGRKRQGIQDILESTGVFVETPDSSDSSLTVRLFGPKAKLGLALTEVLKRAESVRCESVAAPAWLHRFIIGRKGANLEKLTKDKEKVNLSFLGDENKISVEGPPDDIESVVSGLRALVDELNQNLSFCEVPVDLSLHKHIIGREGSTITKIKRDTGCSFMMIGEPPGKVRIEGHPTQVEKAKEEINKIVDSVENNKSKDVIIDRNLIPRIIGPKGKKIKPIQDQYPKVRFIIPGPDKDSEVMSIRGPRDDVEAVTKLVKKMISEIKEASYSEQIYVPSKYHRNVIGREGVTIRQLREETQTRIDFPTAESKSEMITVTGRKSDVKKAIRKIADIYATQENIIEDEIDIPIHLHNRLIGRKGQRLAGLQESLGNSVNIRFPRPDSGSSLVNIRGSRDDVVKAREALLKLKDEEEEQNCEDQIALPFSFHRFVIGPRGSNAKKVREESKARITFPYNEENAIYLSGSKLAVQKAKEMLLEIINGLGEIVTETVEIDPKWHRNFTKRRGVEINNVSDTFGVKMIIPKAGAKSSLVSVEGPKEKVAQAIEKIKELVFNFENTTTEEFLISHRHRQYLLNYCYEDIYSMCEKYNVEINISGMEPTLSKPSSPPVNGLDSAICSDSSISSPSKSTAELNGLSNSHPLVNGNSGGAGDNLDVISETSSTTSSFNMSSSNLHSQTYPIRIRGLKDSIAKVKIEIMNFCPVDEEMSVPFSYHGRLIGAQGKTIREIQEKYCVELITPPSKQKANYITIRGVADNVKEARKHIEELVVTWNKSEEDKRARNFSLHLHVPAKHYRTIIGNKGATISQLREKHGVIITIPNQQNSSKEEISIKGYKHKAEACREEILAIIRKIESRVTVELVIDPLVHPRLIGSKGSGLENLRRKFGVDVIFPPKNTSGPEAKTVYLTGERDAVDECSDYLINIANDMLEEMDNDDQPSRYSNGQPPQSSSRTLNDSPSSNTKFSNTRNPPKSGGFTVRNAPWEHLATNSHHSLESASSLSAATDSSSESSLVAPDQQRQDEPPVPHYQTDTTKNTNGTPDSKSWSQIVVKKNCN